MLGLKGDKPKLFEIYFKISKKYTGAGLNLFVFDKKTVYVKYLEEK